MIYDSKKPLEANQALSKLSYLIEQGKVFEIKEKRFTRSLRQNRALHLFFTFIAKELNDLGMEFTYTGLNVDTVSVMYTPEIVKNFFWRPIQITLFGIQSTKDLETHQINNILDVIVKFFGEKGVLIEFPTDEILLSEEVSKQ